MIFCFFHASVIFSVLPYCQDLPSCPMPGLHEGWSYPSIESGQTALSVQVPHSLSHGTGVLGHSESLIADASEGNTSIGPFIVSFMPV